MNYHKPNYFLHAVVILGILYLFHITLLKGSGFDRHPKFNPDYDQVEKHLQGS